MDIKKNAPSGAQLYRIRNDGVIEYFKHDYYWKMWTGCGWVITFWNRHKRDLGSEFNPI